jgi:hypothetical protein
MVVPSRIAKDRSRIMQNLEMLQLCLLYRISEALLAVTQVLASSLEELPWTYEALSIYFGHWGCNVGQCMLHIPKYEDNIIPSSRISKSSLPAASTTVSMQAGEPGGVPNPAVSLSSSLSLFCDGVVCCIDVLIGFCFRIGHENGVWEFDVLKMTD